MYQNLAEKKTVLGDKPHLFPTSPFLKNVRINTANAFIQTSSIFYFEHSLNIVMLNHKNEK